MYEGKSFPGVPPLHNSYLIYKNKMIGSVHASGPCSLLVGDSGNVFVINGSGL